MKGFLLDTNVISEVAKKRAAPSVLQRLRATRDEALFTSVVCVMELRAGAARHPRGAQLWERLNQEILWRLQTLPITIPVAIRAGNVLADLLDRGAPIGVEDVLIAATALEHDLVVVTRNLQHFSRLPRLPAESWWNDD